MKDLVAVMPTLGRSAHLDDALAALADEDVPVILVGPRDVVESRPQIGDVETIRAVPTDATLGFAGAVNRGLDTHAARGARWVALVNDDAVVLPGWASRLLRAAEASPEKASEVASVQGLVLRMDRPELVDGAGIAWNSWWQAVQLGHLHPAEPFAEAEPFEIFGASATAALFRRHDLDAIARPGEDGPEIFDPSLGSYYEDVDLAIRLRAAGRRSLCVPAAQALHAGGATGETLAGGSEPLVRRNRYPILARLLGSGLWRRLPRAVLRDLLDAGRLLQRRRFGEAGQVISGTARGLLRLSTEIRLHRPRVDPAECRGRFGAELGPS